MKKILIIVLALSLFSPQVFAASNLFEFFGGHIPSVAERAELYETVFLGETYTGTAMQNVKFLSFLEGMEYKEKVYGGSERLGGSVNTPAVVALFETSLASAITSSATSFTLTSATDKDGNTFASSTYAFIIDEGSASEEMVIADCTATVCTNVSRGISALTGTTTVAALQKSHRRGASVKITDGPFLVQLSQIVRGRQNIETLLQYDNKVVVNSSSATTTIVTKAYVDAQVSAGCADANTTTRGCVEIATRAEVASSTSVGNTGAIVVIPASAATSTPGANIAAAGGTGETYVPVTEDDGKLNQGFIDLNEGFGFGTSSPSTGGNIRVAATTTSGSIMLASSTEQINGSGVTLNYAAITSQPASSSVLQFNGGSSVIADRLDYQKLCEEVLPAPSATSTCSWTGSATDLRGVFDSPGASGNVHPQIQFNTDFAGGSTNYGFMSRENYATIVETAANTLRIKLATSATTTDTYFIYETNNNVGAPKIGFYTMTNNTGIPAIHTGTGNWYNTSAQITTFIVRTNSVASTWDTGTRLTVYGKRN